MRCGVDSHVLDVAKRQICKRNRLKAAGGGGDAAAGAGDFGPAILQSLDGERVKAQRCHQCDVGEVFQRDVLQAMESDALSGDCDGTSAWKGRMGPVDGVETARAGQPQRITISETAEDLDIRT